MRSPLGRRAAHVDERGGRFERPERAVAVVREDDRLEDLLALFYDARRHGERVRRLQAGGAVIARAESSRLSTHDSNYGGFASCRRPASDGNWPCVAETAPRRRARLVASRALL